MNLLQLIGRSEALFEHDIARHEKALSEMVSSSRFLVIGGAGSGPLHLPVIRTPAYSNNIPRC